MNRALAVILVAYGFVFWVFIVPYGLLFIGYLHQTVILPASLSLSVDCHPRGYEVATQEIKQMGFEVAGTYNQATDEIKIYVPDPITIKHELCHREQAEQNRSYNCNYPLGVFINELECYWRQNYMDYVNLSLENINN